jgi:CRP-like cAMP-binding protein
MSLDDDIAFFERVPILAALGKPALRILAIGAESRHLPSGSVLFYAGDLADAGYLLQGGSLMIEPGSPSDGSEFNVGPGTLLGELALLTDTVSTTTATAAEPCTVIRISRSLFLKMLEGYPVAAKKLRDMMALRIDSWTRELSAVQAAMDPGEEPR